MRAKLILVLGLVWMLGFLSVPRSFAAIYQYVDKDGVVGFADELQNVPEPYRATAKILSGAVGEKSLAGPANRERSKTPAGPVDQAPAADPVAAEQQAPAEAPGEARSFGNRALTSTVVVACALFAVIVLGIFKKDHKKLVSMVRLIVLSGMTAYLLFAHAGDVARAYRTVRSGIESVQKQSEERGKKAAKAMKALKSMADEVERLQGSLEEADPQKKEEEADPEKKE